MSMKEFVASTHLPPALVRAVVRQIGGWEAFRQSAPDVARHGINGGFHGFIYFRDTVAFAKRHKADILSVANMEDFGESGLIAFLAGFNCLKGETQEGIADGLYNPRSDNRTMVFNALAWFAGEEVCRAYEAWIER